MVKAFVFGKFLPFHKGHQAMIAFALEKCDLLTVLVCCSDKEAITPAIRKSWIERTFPDNSKLEVRTFSYLESEFPNTSASSREVSGIWSCKFRELFPDYTLLISSEPYGSYVAEFMGIQHESFDIGRENYPVSATAIRNNLLQDWAYLPEAVKPYFTLKVVLLGTESTGKTTLAQKLAQHFGASCVLEAARDIIGDSKKFSLDDLHAVAQEHENRINACAANGSPLLFIDTDIHITQSYASFMFGKQLDYPLETFSQRQAAVYLYLNNDVPHVQDGTRLDEKERNQLDLFHRETLRTYGIDYHEIKGNWQERFEQSVALINQMLLL